MTIWNFVGIWFGLAAYAVAWIRGGRVERFGAGFMIAFCMVSFITYKWAIGGLHIGVFIEYCLRFLVFGWLCLQADRWWPFVVTGALGLSVLVHAMAWLDPALSETEAFSAQVGLGYLIDLTILLSVFERRLAGEEPAGRAAWAAAEAATTARRKRKDETHPTAASAPVPGRGAAVIPGRKSTRAVSV
ncbi:hypothetical protein BrevBR_15030 [Brevundimonas sp. BR2-1]|uniref:hypothetical protein n=1 Tax=unclassified Brevundimonas TaxID=2622653 RepID=UPI002FC82560